MTKVLKDINVPLVGECNERCIFYSDVKSNQ